MKQTFLVLLFSTFCWLSSEAQCKFKPIPSKLKRYCNASNKPSPDTHTKMRVFFDKLYFVGQASFAKQGDQYFFSRAIRLSG